MKRALFIFLLFFVGCQTAVQTPSVTINNHLFVVEIAQTPEQQEQGLMYRTSLEKDHGMLFIFQEEDQWAFWMKDTKIPLDMIFINKTMTIVDIIQAAPCTQDPCPNYIPQEKALYVLEINQGAAEQNHIKIGDSIDINIK